MLGQTGAGLAADGDGDLDVDQDDYTYWKNRFGNTSGSGSSAVSAAVPEPSSLAMLLIGLAIALCWPVMKGNNMIRPAAIRAAAVLIVAWVSACSSVQAAVTNDREYWFGEDGLEGTSQGATIGISNTLPLAAGNTADSKGGTGAYLDLTQSGSPTYQDVGPGDLARPGVSGTEYGARFDGVDDRLTGIPLNRPDNISLVLPDYPYNYDGITSRGVQMWVYPSAAKVGVAAQTILLDTWIMGGPQISADGKWTQANSGHSTGNPGLTIPADVPVVGDTWYHVMQHVYNQDDPGAPQLISGGGGTNHRAILFVNGVAVSANADNIPAEADPTAGGYSGDLVVGAEDDGLGGFTKHFQGVIDDLEMYVFGVNDVATDFGTFDLFADNAWIAQEIIDTVPNGVLLPGDVNKDGFVDSGDVAPFVAGYGSSNVMVGATAGSPSVIGTRGTTAT